MKRLRGALLDGTFTPDEYAEEKCRLSANLAEHRDWIAAHDVSVVTRIECVDILSGVFTDPTKLLDGLTVSQTKSLTRIVFGEFTLTREKTIEPSQD